MTSLHHIQVRPAPVDESMALAQSTNSVDTMGDTASMNSVDEDELLEMLSAPTTQRPTIVPPSVSNPTWVRTASQRDLAEEVLRLQHLLMESQQKSQEAMSLIERQEQELQASRLRSGQTSLPLDPHQQSHVILVQQQEQSQLVQRSRATLDTRLHEPIPTSLAASIKSAKNGRRLLQGSARLSRSARSALSSKSMRSHHSTTSVDHPPEFLCPITYELMAEPVVAPDGFTYEKAAICAWFQRNKTSPMTGADLASVAVHPNQVLKTMIKEYCSKNNLQLPSPTIDEHDNDVETLTASEEHELTIEDLIMMMVQESMHATGEDQLSIDSSGNSRRPSHNLQRPRRTRNTSSACTLV
eukprot:m.362248 g.362248  ORF g.362248 m.362248 type:complete len:356 (+) comp20252_c0_seq1:495-1562(+)